jgi:hypothetical protein
LHRLAWFARLAAAAAALLAAGSAQAENWWYISHNADQLVLMDADSRRGEGSSRSAVIRTYPTRSDGRHNIAGARIEADCAGNRVRYLHVTGYSAAMQVLADGPPPEGYREWRQLQPTNNGALVVRFACGEEGDSTWQPFRLGTLAGGPGDQSMLAALVADGLPPTIAALAALGQMTREQAELMLREVTADEAAVLRRHGFPR